MSYRHIAPPLTKPFEQMTEAELRAYLDWFTRSVPARIAELHSYVTSDRTFESWRPDRTPASLDRLGEWFVAKARPRPLTEQELGSLPEHVRVMSSNTLSSETFSLTVDIGMYLAEVLFHAYPGLHWSQERGAKRSVDFGHVVLDGFKVGSVNPVRLVHVLASKLIEGRSGPGGLRQVFDAWGKKLE
jgi:hypothetical protein